MTGFNPLGSNSVMVGRKREKALLCSLIQQDNPRLVTLTGPGGIGKTTLALEVAKSLNQYFPAGIFIIPLEYLTDQKSVISAIARSLGILENNSHLLLESLSQFVKDKSLLLVLDNFEHVLEAAPLLTELLTTSPTLKLLVTSRERLHLYPEYEFPVPPLSLPEFSPTLQYKQIEVSEAVELFVTYATKAAPDFILTPENSQTVAAICYHLDAISLALELAAGQLSVKSPEELLTYLTTKLRLELTNSNLGRRHSSLGHTLDWSYDLLDATSQRLLGRLGIFRGSFEIGVAKMVCSDSEIDFTEEELINLCNKSWLQSVGETKPRFKMLETLREYALEKLKESGEYELYLSRHAQYYLQVVSQPDYPLNKLENPGNLMEIELDYPNIRAALSWSLASENWEGGLELAAALWSFWYMRGYLSEGRDWLDKLLAGQGSPQNQVGVEIRAKALTAAGNLALQQGDNIAGLSSHQEALKLWRKLQLRSGLMRALNSLGALHLERGEYDEATLLLEEAYVLGQNEKTPLTANILNSLGLLALAKREFTKAENYFQTGLNLAQILGEHRIAAAICNNLGEVACYQGQYSKGHEWYSVSLNIAQGLQDKAGLARAIHNFGYLALSQGKLSEAQGFLEEALTQFSEMNHWRGETAAMENLGLCRYLSGYFQEGVSLCQQASEIRRKTDDRVGLAYSLKTLAYFAWKEQETIKAGNLYRESLKHFSAIRDRLGIAEVLEGIASIITHINVKIWLLSGSSKLREEIGCPVIQFKETEYRELLAKTMKELSESSFTEEWELGRKLTLEQLVNEATN